MCWCGLFDLGTMCDAMAGLSILPILGERLKYRGTTSTNKTAFHAFMFSAILSLSLSLLCVPSISDRLNAIMCSLESDVTMEI